MELLPHGRQRIFYLETGGQKRKGINLFMEDGRSLIWKLEAKYGRELLHHGRRQTFYQETRDQILKGITSSWKTEDLLPRN
jgi:hypothetical protein